MCMCRNVTPSRVLLNIMTSHFSTNALCEFEVRQNPIGHVALVMEGKVYAPKAHTHTNHPYAQHQPCGSLAETGERSRFATPALCLSPPFAKHHSFTTYTLTQRFSFHP